MDEFNFPFEVPEESWEDLLFREIKFCIMSGKNLDETVDCLCRQGPYSEYNILIRWAYCNHQHKKQNRKSLDQAIEEVERKYNGNVNLSEVIQDSE